MSATAQAIRAWRSSLNCRPPQGRLADARSQADQRAQANTGSAPRIRLPAIAVGIDLDLTPTPQGGRATPLLNLPDRRWTYRPNWGLPSMIPPDQSGAPVLAFSRDEILPGESAYAVIATVFPGMVDQWNLEVEPGVVLPMYEGTRVCGHGTVVWRTNVTLPLSEADERRFLTWLDDPTAALGEA